MNHDLGQKKNKNYVTNKNVTGTDGGTWIIP